MNRHFRDAQYYLKRAAETAKDGVAEELEPVRERFRALTGEDDEPEPGRLEELRSNLRDVQERAEGDARDAIADAREKLETYRQDIAN